MSDSALVSQIFSELTLYLNNIKSVLQGPEITPINDELEELLITHKHTLEEINDKMNSYKLDVNSTIEHIDQILNEEDTNATGGKRKRRKSRQRKRTNKKRTYKK